MFISFKLLMRSPSPDMPNILMRDSCVRSSESFERPSRWAIHTDSFFFVIAKCMYPDSCRAASSIWRTPTSRLTIKLLLSRTKSDIQSYMSRLFPMAISLVFIPFRMSSRLSREASSTMSRWLDMNV